MALESSAAAILSAYYVIWVAMYYQAMCNLFLPFSLKFASNHPQNRFFSFHSDSPWRTMTILYFPAILIKRRIMSGVFQIRLQTILSWTNHQMILCEQVKLYDLHRVGRSSVCQACTNGVKLTFVLHRLPLLANSDVSNTLPIPALSCLYQALSEADFNLDTWLALLSFHRYQYPSEVVE